MRLFAAVLPPARAIAELRVAVTNIAAAPGLRWTADAGWHFTLAFMGEVGEELLPDLHARMERAAAKTAAFTLRVHGSGHFGERALWAGAAGGLDELRMLAERADAAARRAGVPMDQHHRYTPHLTLARSAEGTDLRPYTEALAGFEGSPWPVRELSLVRSNPTRGADGSRYEVVGAWPLGG
ncbi:RNA 2',3'-cyclic phosphodiesterase [Streptomyces sp. NBC_00536]|uniref:RNA 2',3'-cyclic phosphodiesterase n=1 Tax=Streptomyces sp. NBC_00536 TaxID=2975769 RepID=UPI002E817A5E|nr:RNA 2',3'-cyclic phosphodiesterase [Streptomyces sp. NBC_00536]WUC80445.1 RNA 2',3'-cyclic phosphodiesterase [Streptomyces sp. NBC_00536]